MPINRTRLKLDARRVIAETKPSPISVGLSYLVLCMLMATLCDRLLTTNVTMNGYNAYMKYVQAGYFERALELASTMMPSRTAVAINVVLRLLMQVVAAGFVLFLINCVRRTGPALGNLLDGFGFAWKILLLTILSSVLVTLWCLLLIVPGIIAAYRYRMAIYILVDDPSLSVPECLRRSKEMMKGHKWELFKLDLSFLGWYLLEILPIVGYAVQVWAVPYINTTMVEYYEFLRLGCKQTDNAAWNPERPFEA